MAKRYEVERTKIGISEFANEAYERTNKEAWSIISNAEANAGDTIYEDPTADYVNIFFCSLESILSYEPINHHTRRYFQSRGIKW